MHVSRAARHIVFFTNGRDVLPTGWLAQTLPEVRAPQTQ